MSTFYVLPPRPYLAEYLAAAVRSLFPGMTLVEEDWALVVDALGTAAARRQEVLVVYREELPEGPNTVQSLADGFGAEPGDEVVEIHAIGRPGELIARRWSVPEAA